MKKALTVFLLFFCLLPVFAEGVYEEGWDGGALEDCLEVWILEYVVDGQDYADQVEYAEFFNYADGSSGLDIFFLGETLKSFYFEGPVSLPNDVLQFRQTSIEDDYGFYDGYYANLVSLGDYQWYIVVKDEDDSIVLEIVLEE